MSPGILHLIEHPLASKHLAELTLSATVSPVCLLVHNLLTTQIAVGLEFCNDWIFVSFIVKHPMVLCFSPCLGF